MSTKVVYTCDICKREATRPELCSIDFKATKPALNIPMSATTGWTSVDICIDCLKSLGFKSMKDGGSQVEVQNHNQKTLEDKFVDILCDMGVAFSE